MKKIPTLICALIINTFCSAQYLYLDIKLNECMSCYSGLINLDVQKIKMPVFAGFKEVQREDSADIEYKFKLNKMFHIKAVYNDKFYREMNDSFSTVTLYDEDGVLQWTKPLKTIGNELAAFDMYKTSSFEYNSDCLHIYNGDRLYKFNYSTGTLRAYTRDTKRRLFEINAVNFPFDSLEAKMDREDKHYFKQVKTTLNQKSNLSPRYIWVNLTKDGTIYLSFLCFTAAYDSQSKEIKIVDKYAIAKFSKDGKFLDVFPVQDRKASLTSGYNIYGGYFAMIDSSSFMICTHNWQYWYDEILKVKQDSALSFITLFKLKEGRYCPEKYLPIEFPYAHRIKYFENDMSAIHTNYPFVAFAYSNEINNIENGTKTFLVNDNDFKKSVNQDRGTPVGSPYLVQFKSRIIYHCNCICSTCWA